MTLTPSPSSHTWWVDDASDRIAAGAGAGADDDAGVGAGADGDASADAADDVVVAAAGSSSAAAEPVCAIFANCRNHGMNNKHPRTTGAGGWGAVRLNFGCFIWLAFRTF